jgi:hypothetical protein
MRILTILILSLCLVTISCRSADSEKKSEDKSNEPAPAPALSRKGYKQFIEDYEKDASEVKTLEQAIMLTPNEDLHTIPGGDGSAYIITHYGVYYVKGIIAIKVREPNTTPTAP